MSNSGSVGTDVLRVIFDREGDRFVHQIVCSAGNGPHPVLISKEGGPDDAWPASPALQSLHLETRPEGLQTAMLVGMAGSSHWSMSVAVDGGQHKLLFDVASRVHEQPEWLGSTYVSCDQSGENWPPECLSLEVWPVDPIEPEVAVQVERFNQSVQISAVSSLRAYPQTIRWRYAIGIKQYRTS